MARAWLGTCKTFYPCAPQAPRSFSFADKRIGYMPLANGSHSKGSELGRNVSQKQKLFKIAKWHIISSERNDEIN